MAKTKLTSAMSGPLTSRRAAPYLVTSLVALLLLAVIWAATIRVISLEFASADAVARQSCKEVAETYEAQMVRNLGAIDQTLRLIAYAHDLHGGQVRLAELREKGVLPPSVVFDVTVADRTGTVRNDDATPDYTMPSVADEPYFKAQRALDTGTVYVGKASFNKETGLWALQFSRRLNAPDGSFDGVAVVAVDPAYFTSGYERSRMGALGMVGLLGPEGEFRVKRSGDDVSSGLRVDYNLATGSHGDLLASGVLLVSPWDGIRRYTSAKRLHGLPLTAIVGLAENEQLAAFEAHQHTYLLEAAAASLMLVGVAATLGRLYGQLSRSRRRIQKIQETYYAASEASVEAFFLLQCKRDPTGRIVDFSFSDTNTRGEQLLGIDRHTLRSHTLCQVLPRASDSGLLDDLIEVAETGRVHEKEWRNTAAALGAEWLYRQVVRVEDGVVAIVRDISERKNLEMQVQYQATHDTLTGLANRHLLDDRLNAAIAQAARFGHPVWVAFVDLDRFKLVNDSLGHKAGDLVLRTIADRLRSTLRDTDTISRLGGDEFVLILPGLGEGGLDTPLLQRVMDVVAQPILIEDKEFFLGCSIGVSVYPGDADTASLLIERADIAMYRAKETGRNNFQFFTEEMNQRLVERLRIESALRTAVEHEQFVLYYQPKVDIASGSMVGAEALIRWQHPELGLVSPARFIGMAEETGLIVPIGYWVVRAACEQGMAWQRAGLGSLTISVNLSARQFAEPDLVQAIAAILAETGMPPQQLEIELTESLVMANVEHVIGVLHEFKALGVKLSVDDFGTGYSSLSYLKRFPLDVLKIDRSFIHDIATDPDAAAIVLSIISLAHSLRLRVVAEGVEDAGQLDYLRQHDCDEMQGYYFSKPLPPDEFGILLRKAAERVD